MLLDAHLESNDWVCIEATGFPHSELLKRLETIYAGYLAEASSILTYLTEG